MRTIACVVVAFAVRVAAASTRRLRPEGGAAGSCAENICGGGANYPVDGTVFYSEFTVPGLPTNTSILDEGATYFVRVTREVEKQGSHMFVHQGPPGATWVTGQGSRRIPCSQTSEIPGGGWRLLLPPPLLPPAAVILSSSPPPDLHEHLLCERRAVGSYESVCPTTDAWQSTVGVL